MNSQLKKAAGIVVKNCLGVKKGEKVVVVTDRFCRPVGVVLRDALRSITDPIFIEIEPRKIHGEEPPELVAHILKQCDVFIMPTYYSLSHTKSRIEANRHGARGATMPGITTDVMVRTLNADYRKIAQRTRKVAHLLTKARKATIRNDNGTQLELTLERRRAHIDTGIVRNPGECSNLPAGEAYIAPVEDKSNGVAVIDGSFAPVGHIRKDVIVGIKNGKIIDIRGNKTLKTMFKKYGKREKVLCELGIGTNPKAKITGNVLEDEKVFGSIHIAFGNNVGFGGRNKARSHLDAVIKKPSVWLDETLILEKGNLLI